MKTERRLPAHLACALILAFVIALPARAQDAACLTCHAALSQKKVVHPAVQMGCVSCHSELDATAVPHKSKGKIAKGLAVAAPELCAKCHDRKLFEGKVVHAPAAGGMCLGCHNPHASDQVGLLTKDPATLCLDCHPDVKKRPHVVAGFSGSGHPLGDAKKAKEVEDPLRPGKKFYCAACHEPHRSAFPSLTRFGNGMSSCQKCHKV